MVKPTKAELWAAFAECQAASAELSEAVDELLVSQMVEQQPEEPHLRLVGVDSGLGEPAGRVEPAFLARPAERVGPLPHLLGGALGLAELVLEWVLRHVASRRSERHTVGGGSR